MSRTALLLILMTLPALAAAQVYRWIDDKGQVHFSQTPPPSGTFDLIQPRRTAGPAAEQAAPASPTGAAAAAAAAVPPVPTPPTAAAVNAKFLEDAAAENKLKAAAKAASDQARADKTRKCETARARAQLLQDLPPLRLAGVAEDGNVTRLDDDEFAKRRAAAQKDVDSHCR